MNRQSFSKVGMAPFHQNHHSTGTSLVCIDVVLNVLITDTGGAPGVDHNPLSEDFNDPGLVPSSCDSSKAIRIRNWNRVNPSFDSRKCILVSEHPSSVVDDHPNFQVALVQKTVTDDIKRLHLLCSHFFQPLGLQMIARKNPRSTVTTEDRAERDVISVTPWNIIAKDHSMRGRLAPPCVGNVDFVLGAVRQNALVRSETNFEDTLFV